ncbi:hypothetical protein PVAND_009660 [Polypedilum vanderplanki]|uniref:Small ribosomal subunit protein bS6m n=1 Tax=Polypedilum vanderplanki TaxID=319348 RepID=A0A9J6CDW3_POLVA|nr:hypothetical protein PVAND_009660 [Polypedilum vanderplanki]
MPTYELALMLRTMSRPEIVTTLKRTTEAIFSKGGFLRQLDYLGDKQLPYRVHKNSQKHFTGSAFIVTFDVSPKKLDDLLEEYTRDVDILKRSIFKIEDEPQKIECTLDEELKPPAYRKEVINMMEKAAKGQKEKYPQNTGLNYYPFQK